MGFSVCCRFRAGRLRQTGGDRETRRKMSSRFAWRVDFLFRVWENFSFFFFVDDDSGFSGGAMCDAATHSLLIFHAKDASYRESGEERYQRQQEAKGS